MLSDIKKFAKFSIELIKLLLTQSSELRVSRPEELHPRPLAGRVENWRDRLAGYGGYSSTFALALSPSPIPTFPVPASSNPSCRFPATGFPDSFISRVM